LADFWDDEFDWPIPLPAGGELVTLRDAGAYIDKLPKRVHDRPEWQLAVKELMRAATETRRWPFARIAIIHAIYGVDPPPIGNPKGAPKSPKWRGNRKRDAWR
jgi:hypothetical protein